MSRVGREVRNRCGVRTRAVSEVRTDVNSGARAEAFSIIELRSPFSFFFVAFL